MDNKSSYQELVRLSLAYRLAEDKKTWSKLFDVILIKSQSYYLEPWYEEGRRLAEIVKNSPLYKALNEE